MCTKGFKPVYRGGIYKFKFSKINAVLLLKSKNVGNMTKFNGAPDPNLAILGENSFFLF